MKFPSFFKSRATKYGSIVGGVVFAAGTGGSAALSLRLASLCSSEVASFMEHIGTNLAISELNGVIDIGRFSANFTIHNVTTSYPAGWLDVIKSTEELPPYCFGVPFTLGLCLTTAISLALASAITTAIHVHNHGDQHHRDDDN